MTKTHVVLTVDVEPSVAGAFADPKANRPLIHEPVWGELSGRSEALGFIIRTLGRHNLKATFFVETAHVGYFSSAPMGHYTAELAHAHQDIQLHVHPVWQNFRGDKLNASKRVSDNCDEIAPGLLVELIEQGASQIAAWTGRRPSGMRTGNFSTSRQVYVAMRRAGLRFSSNICAAQKRPNEAELVFHGGARNIEGIIELPVTCFTDHGPIGRGKLRPLQVTACSFTEMKTALDNLSAAGGEVAVIVTHPFEFLKKDDFRYSHMRANRLVQSRFEKLCAFLAENEDRFETETLEGAIACVKTPSIAPPLNGRIFHSMIRAAQNLVNDSFL